MTKRTRKAKSSGLVFLAAAATLSSPFMANAQSIPYECNLSGTASGSLSGCAGSSVGGYLTSTSAVTGTGLCTGSDYCGVNSNTSSAVAPVSAWNICRWLDNTSSQQAFVPFKTTTEWTTFLANPPTFTGGGTINISHCAVPYTVNGAPATVTIMPPFAGCTSITGNNPNVYGRSGVSLYPHPAVAGPSFTCHGGATSMMSLAQWRAGDIESTAPGTSSWTNNYQYSPDILLTPGAVVVDEGTPVTLNWSITPHGGASVTCTVSPGGWGPDSVGNPRIGSSTVTLAATTTFTISCTQSPSLTSVASTTVVGNPPPPPPPPPCCTSGDSSSSSG
mgnify:FL=1